MKKLLYLFLLLSNNIFYCNIYIYPVACFDNGQNILFVQQEQTNNIKLMLRNRKLNSWDNCLWSIHNPTRVQLLPDETGFSFIDNGRVRIKYFDKRSAKTIDFDTYFYDLSQVHWAHSRECYFSAKAHSGLYSIFNSSTDGKTGCLVSHKTSDCMYPQKVGTDLFFIQKDKDKTYHVIQTSYSTDKNRKYRRVVTFNNESIAFLHMRSQTEGFVVSYDGKNINTDVITFTYHRLYKTYGFWRDQALFSFNVPSYLLFSRENQLCDSLLPLLPRIVNKKRIYFVDAHKTGETCFLKLFSYDLHTNSIKELVKINESAHKNYKHLFVPIVLEKVIFLGGEVLC